jgi:antitoxin (DNA-binding transcriptional repressor) of toxin-antitoxin stability system
MTTITIEEAQSNLPQLIDQLAPGEESVITRNHQTVAKVVGLPVEKPHPVPGRCKGMLTIVAEDDEHLRDWEEYMP